MRGREGGGTSAGTETPAARDLDGERSETRLRQAVERAKSELDLRDATTTLFFGSKAQEDLTAISDEMLEGVRNKDIGPAGSALGEMLATLRGFDPGDLDPSRERGLLRRVFGAGKPVAKILQRYEEVRGQIDSIGDRLEVQKGTLLRDVALLDRLYDKTLEYFHALAAYITAGEETLEQLDKEEIPAIERRLDKTGEVIRAQELRDLRMLRDDLDRRVHDLKLTRQVAMQALPSIRLVQENDKSLIGKIGSVLANTVPLWRQQLAQAITIHRSREAGRTLKEATDLTNELLLANAETLRQANVEIRREVERGVFDLEAVRKANDLLVATIEDSLRIADEGRQSRASAEVELRACEARLRETLSAARGRQIASDRR